jgi:hypothetical protein
MHDQITRHEEIARRHLARLEAEQIDAEPDDAATKM